MIGVSSGNAQRRKVSGMTFNCSPLVKALWYVWLLLPFALLFVVPALLNRGGLGGEMQVSKTTYLYTAALGGSWMVIGLAFVPFLGVHGSSLARALLVTIGWSAFLGQMWAQNVMDLRCRPPASTVAQPVEFVAVTSRGHMVEVRPASGDAAEARFLFRQEQWNAAYERAGRRAVKGKVYQGRHDLWFANLD